MDNTQERLNLYTYIQEGHLLWGGKLHRDGYGQVKVDGKFVYTHRLAWEIAYGPIPEGIQVLHLCNTPPCILPRHLYLGTPADNMRDVVLAGNHGMTTKTHCPYGHPYDEANTYYNGRYRICRTCDRERK
ncbi:hypothetical protein LCGC14_0644130 [marine sediment metagenome]|uniref:HNH nuclease domain-containing protein n=1 Tax=marine sediment metagenome TaxID=412755 RepID=A0A0F9R3H5_9ZZZZ